MKTDSARDPHPARIRPRSRSRARRTDARALLCRHGRREPLAGLILGADGNFYGTTSPRRQRCDEPRGHGLQDDARRRRHHALHVRLPAHRRHALRRGRRGRRRQALRDDTRHRRVSRQCFRVGGGFQDLHAFSGFFGGADGSHSEAGVVIGPDGSSTARRPTAAQPTSVRSSASATERRVHGPALVHRIRRRQDRPETARRPRERRRRQPLRHDHRRRLDEGQRLPHHPGGRRHHDPSLRRHGRLLPDGHAPPCERRQALRHDPDRRREERGTI